MKSRAISVRAKPNAAYSQVIFIMKDKQSAVIDFVAEAEMIINNNNYRRRPAELKREEGINKVIIRQSTTERLLWSWITLLCCIGLIFGAVMLSPFGLYVYEFVMGY